MSPEETALGQGLAVALARVEGKIDAYAARTSAVEQRLDDVDVRLREAASEEDVRALDDRLRAQETRSVVTPTGLVAAIASTVAILGGFITFLDRLYS